MEIKFLEKLEGIGDFVTLRYNIDEKKIDIEVGGTAMSVFDWHDLTTEELGEIFIPLLWQVSDQLSEQGALLEKIKMDSEGLKDLHGKIIYSRDRIQQLFEEVKQRKQNDQTE